MLGMLDLRVELDPENLTARVRHRLDGALGGVREGTPTRRNPDHAVVVAGPHRKFRWDPLEERVIGTIELDRDPAELRGSALHRASEMPAQELVPHADAQDGNLHGVNPIR